MASAMNVSANSGAAANKSKQIPLELLMQHAANIVAELHDTFSSLPEDNSIIPAKKFAKYAQCIQVYVVNNIESLLMQITDFIYNKFGDKITHDECREYVYILLSKYFSKKTYSIELVSNLLRNHRYLIYLTNYVNIISTPIDADPEEYIKKLKETDIETKLPNYFKLDNVMVVYSLLYLLYQYDELKIEGFGLEDLPSLKDMEIEYIVNSNIINSQLESIDKFMDNIGNIKSKYLISHGAPTELLSVVPPNKILVIITPFNRLGYTPNKEYLLSALSWMLLPDNIPNFIINPVCFIDKLIATPANADSSNCILNGIQIYYPGQTYFDIKLSQSEIDIAKKLTGLYNYNNEIKESNEIDKNKFTQSETDVSFTAPYTMTLSEVLKNMSATNADVPEILIQHSCRYANDKLHNYAIEQQYRFSKIHNIIVGSSSQCMQHEMPKPFYTEGLTCKTNYTQMYMKYSGINSIKSKIPNINSDLFYNTTLSPIRRKQDTIGSLIENISKSHYNPELINELIHKYSDPKNSITIINIAKIFNMPILDYEAKLIGITNELIETKPTPKDMPKYATDCINASIFMDLIYNIINKKSIQVIVLQNIKTILNNYIDIYFTKDSQDLFISDSTPEYMPIYSNFTEIIHLILNFILNFVVDDIHSDIISNTVKKNNPPVLKNILYIIVAKFRSFIDYDRIKHSYYLIEHVINSDLAVDNISELINICEKYITLVTNGSIDEQLIKDVNKTITENTHPLIKLLYIAFTKYYKSVEFKQIYKDEFSNLIHRIYDIYKVIQARPEYAELVKHLLITNDKHILYVNQGNNIEVDGEHIIYTLLNLIMLVWSEYTIEQKRELHYIFHEITKHRLELNTESEILANRRLDIEHGTLFYNIARLYIEPNRAIINEIVGNMDYIPKMNEIKSLGTLYTNIRNLGPVLGRFASDEKIKNNMLEFVKQCIPVWIKPKAVKRLANQIYNNNSGLPQRKI